MIAIARLADRGPTAAAGVAAALQLGGLLSFPVIGAFMVVPVTLSAAVVAFVILRRGEAAAVRAGGICFAILVVVSLLMLRSAVAIPIAALFSWLPAIAAAAVLRRTSSLAWALLAVSAIGAASVVLLALVTGDPEAFWAGEITRMMSLLAEQGNIAVDAEQIAPAAATLAFWMTGMAGLSLFTTAVAALFIARHWQAALMNPGGFKAEFHALALGWPAAVVALLALLVAGVFQGPVSAAIAMVIGACFVLQGLAVVHALVAKRGLSSFWLVGVYALLFIPQTWLLLAALGLIDNQIAFRRA